MNPPPPLPRQDVRDSFFHHAATASVLATPLAIGINLLRLFATSGLSGDAKRGVTILVSGLASLILLLGVVAGVVALFGLPRYGRKGILVKALCGIFIPIGLTVLAIPTVMAAKSRAVQLRQKVVDRELTAVVDKINAGSPKMIDDDTRLEGAQMEPNHTLVYNYKTVNSTREDFEAGGLTKVIGPKLVELYRRRPDLKAFRDNGVTMIYRYRDKEGQMIEEVSAGPRDLK